MKLILLSGGSGKRLWPLSNDSRSKQFLKILKNPHDQLESMVQRVWRQIGHAGLHKDTYIATGKVQTELIQNQIGREVPIIIEPERRDTFPAIALAAMYLYSIEGVGMNEVITILPVDPFVNDRFFETMKELESVIQKTDTEIALMGVLPTYPSEKYGYIVPNGIKDKASNDFLSVSHFVEKPQQQQAEMLIEQNAFWNCGVFAFKMQYMIDLLIEKGIPIHYEELLKHYHRLEKTSFDYEVVEKAKHIAVIPYSGYWKDLGTWNTLTEEMEENVIGNGRVSNDCCNTHIVNELDIPVAVLGLSNVIVSSSPDGILVADKSASPHVKQLIGDLNQRPMFEERRWGTYRVLDYKKFNNGNQVLTKRICIKEGKHLSYQQHYKRSEIWTVISGVGEFILDGEFSRVQAGDVLKIPVFAAHSIKAIHDLEIIEVQSGSELIEEDIIRICYSWDGIVNQYAIGSNPPMEGREY